MIERVPTRLSVEEFEALPAYEGKRELSRTMLIREPPPGPRHGMLAVRISHRLQSWVEAGGGGLAVADAAFVLSHEPPIVRAPDVAWVADADPSRVDDRAWRGAPDLAVEIVSPSDRTADIEEKVGQYVAAGVRLVWIVDPATGEAVEHRPGVGARVIGADGVLDGAEVLPGFRLELADVRG